MSPSVVLTAEQPENNSAPAAMAKGTGGCIRPSAPLAAKTAKYRSNPERDDPCTARIATLPLDDSDRRRIGRIHTCPILPSSLPVNRSASYAIPSPVTNLPLGQGRKE